MGYVHADPGRKVYIDAIHRSYSRHGECREGMTGVVN